MAVRSRELNVDQCTAWPASSRNRRCRCATGGRTGWWRAPGPATPFSLSGSSPCTSPGLVELGTHTGNSYSAFCQAVATLGLNSACYAVDTWQGDPHAGYYGEEVFRSFRSITIRVIMASLDQTPPREALGWNSAKGLSTRRTLMARHTHDAVRVHQKLAPQALGPGIVLFHDINVVWSVHFACCSLDRSARRSSPVLPSSTAMA